MNEYYCWPGQSPVRDTMPQTHGNGKDFSPGLGSEGQQSLSLFLFSVQTLTVCTETFYSKTVPTQISEACLLVQFIESLVSLFISTQEPPSPCSAVYNSCSAVYNAHAAAFP